jgi:hypothetical protein
MSLKEILNFTLLKPNEINKNRIILKYKETILVRSKIKADNEGFNINFIGQESEWNKIYSK